MAARTWAVVAFAVVAAVGCHRKAAPKPRPPAAVVAQPAAARAVPVDVEAIGALEAVSTVEVNARVDGRIERVAFREGDEVREGAPLFSIDPRPFRTTLRSAEAALARDLAQERYAEATRDRYATLVSRKLI